MLLFCKLCFQFFKDYYKLVIVEFFHTMDHLFIVHGICQEFQQGMLHFSSYPSSAESFFCLSL